MSFPQTIQYLESLVDYERYSFWPYQESLRPERMVDFLSVINNPQNNFKSIHVAGTKGKGSTCAFIAYILRQAGFKTGLYTSPHLEDFRERIRILLPISDKRQACLSGRQAISDFEGMISRSDLSRQVEKLKPVIEKFNHHSRHGALTFFEVYTAIAFNYFKEQKVDFAVLETGLGGRLDATNTADALVSVITPISLEHTDKLGRTLKLIAQEKAGIIKSHSANRIAPACRQAGQIVISAPQENQAQKVIREKCRKTGAKLYEASVGNHLNVNPNLLGRHQLINAAVAVAAIESLRRKGIKISKKIIRQGLANTVWPGRCEVIRKNPLIVLDGAQNAASMRALAETIKQEFKYKKLILVLGISSDKDIAGICKIICPLADKIILTQANSSRATDADAIAKQAKRYQKQIIKTRTVKAAKKEALNIAGKEDLILVTGSLFVVGEFRSENA